MWMGIGDMEGGCGRHQEMGRHGDILVWGHITLGTPRGHAGSMGTPWLSPWEDLGDTPGKGTKG